MLKNLKKLTKSLVFGSLALLVGIAIAALWGPFNIATHFPNITFDDDQNVDFQYASSIPRIVMNVSVQNIKKGDTVRVIYANGDVYDFEAAHNYSYASSVNTLISPVKKSSATDEVIPSLYMFAHVIWPTCRSFGNHAYQSLDLGAWVVTSTVSSGVTTVTASWRSINTSNAGWWC